MVSCSYKGFVDLLQQTRQLATPGMSGHKPAIMANILKISDNGARFFDEQAFVASDDADVRILIGEGSE